MPAVEINIDNAVLPAEQGHGVSHSPWGYHATTVGGNKKGTRKKRGGKSNKNKRRSKYTRSSKYTRQKNTRKQRK